MDYQVTIQDERFAQQTAKQINSSYPNKAYVQDGKCFITEAHRNYCLNYVINNCNIRNSNK